jgi:hypothetical protein
MDPKIACILNALDEVKSSMKDQDYRLAIEALAELNPHDKDQEYIISMVKQIPELEIAPSGESTINIAKEMIQSKFTLSEDGVRYLKTLIARGSIHIDLSMVPLAQRHEMEQIKRFIYNICTKNTFTQVRACPHREQDCTGEKRYLTNLCSSVLLLDIMLHDPEEQSAESLRSSPGPFGVTAEPRTRLEPRLVLQSLRVRPVRDRQRRTGGSPSSPPSGVYGL